jgi:hypothetical protein
VDKSLKINIPGNIRDRIAFNPINGYICYIDELKLVSGELTKINKDFECIDSYEYIIGLRRPAHLDQNEFPKYCSTVDGYEVILKLK